jgi:hypothetical protein
MLPSWLKGLTLFLKYLSLVLELDENWGECKSDWTSDTLICLLPTPILGLGKSSYYADILRVLQGIVLYASKLISCSLCSLSDLFSASISSLILSKFKVSCCRLPLMGERFSSFICSSNSSYSWSSYSYYSFCSN